MISILIMVVFAFFASFLVSAPDSNPTDAEAIKQVIVSAYQEGLIKGARQGKDSGTAGYTINLKNDCNK